MLNLYISFAKKLHEKTFPAGTFEDVKEHYQKKLKDITGVLISEENAEKLSRFLDEIPSSNHYLHGDLNPNNLILLPDGSERLYKLIITKYYNEANEEQLQNILQKGKLMGIVHGVTMGLGEGDFILYLKKEIDKIVSEEF